MSGRKMFSIKVTVVENVLSWKLLFSEDENDRRVYVWCFNLKIEAPPPGMSVSRKSMIICRAWCQSTSPLPELEATLVS